MLHSLFYLPSYLYSIFSHPRSEILEATIGSMEYVEQRFVLWTQLVSPTQHSHARPTSPQPGTEYRVTSSKSSSRPASCSRPAMPPRGAIDCYTQQCCRFSWKTSIS